MLRVSNKSRTYYKKIYKGYWRKKWIPGRSIDKWVEVLSNKYGSKRINRLIIDQALFKLELQNYITEKEREDLDKMLDSPDSENHVMVLMVIQSFIPKAFKRRENKDGLPH